MDHIRSVLPELGPSERRVALECVTVPEEVSLLSVAELAARTSTSAGTVIRTAQSLGFRGFQHLRLLLLREIGAARPDTAPAEADTLRARVESALNSAAEHVRSASKALDLRELELAVSALARADRVLIVGNGASASAVQMFALRLVMKGAAAMAPIDAVAQQIGGRSLTASDVMVAMSDSGQNAITLRAVEAARTAGAAVVGITSYAKSRLSELSDITLVTGATWEWVEDFSPTMIQLAIVSVLDTELSRELGMQTNRAGGALLDEVLSLAEEPDDRLA
jgi:DNA-binding MurR/RpiR family transcriptional regulator